MMKSLIKFTLALILVSAFSFESVAQVKFGLKGGVELKEATLSSAVVEVENMTSFSIGPAIEAMILPIGVGSLGVEAALMYNDNRMKVSAITAGGSTNLKEEEVTNRYLDLPVNAKVKFGLGMLPLRLYVAAGPYAAMRIGGDKIDFEVLKDKIENKAFQAGANIGLGLEAFDIVQLGFNYRIKLTDDYSVDVPNWADPLNGKDKIWSITAAVFF